MSGQFADFGLGEAAICQRAPHLVFGSRSHAGAIVSGIIDVGTVENRGHVEFGNDAINLAVKLGLTVVTAIGRVAEVFGIVEFVGRNDDVSNADLVRPAPWPDRVRRTPSWG